MKHKVKNTGEHSNYNTLTNPLPSCKDAVASRTADFAALDSARTGHSPFLRKQSANSGIFCIYSSLKNQLLLN